MATTITFIAFYKIAIFIYIANTETIHVRASFHAFSLILDKSGNISEMVRSQDFTFGI